MAQSITSNKKQINNYFESRVTTHKKNKPNLTDMYLMEVIHHYQIKGALHKCILDRHTWPLELEKFGGKRLSYSAIKRKRRGLEKLDCVISKRERGQRKEYSLWLTDKGIEALKQLKKSYQQRRKKRPLENVKNAPSKCKKRSLESEKTPPPLIHANCVNNDHEKADAVQKMNVQNKTITMMIGIGMFERYATKIYNQYGQDKICFAMEKIKTRKVKNKGAYLVKFLSSYPFGGDEEFNEYKKIIEINADKKAHDELIQKININNMFKTID